MNALCWAWVISLPLNIAFSERAQESHDSVGVVCRGRGWNVIAFTGHGQSAGNRLKWERLLLLFQIIGWKMSVRMKNVSRASPFFFYPNLPRRHLLIGNNACLKLPGCGESRRNWDLICRRESAGVLDNVATRRQLWTHLCPRWVKLP